MLYEIRNRRSIKKANSLNFLKGRQSHNPSQTIGSANIHINSQIVIENLQKLAQTYANVTDPKGFLTDLKNAVGIPKNQRASGYGVITIPREDGSTMEVSLRLANHNANAQNYVDNNANYEFNLSIVIKRKYRRNTFHGHPDVPLKEYVYYGTEMKNVDSPLSQIAKSIANYIQTGIYVDTTKIAKVNPQSDDLNNQDNNQINCNRTMKTNKKTIRLTESNLRSIIAESVKKVLNETTQSIWRNVPNTQFMYHGEWSDPEIIYKGHELNANDVEDYIYDIYKEECEYNSVTPSEDDYEEWIKEQGVSWLKSILDNLI